LGQSNASWNWEKNNCDSDYPTPEYKTPIEARLIKYLQMWRDDRNVVSAFGRPIEREICSLLEWYICECLRYGPPHLQEWWSDGVEGLEISQIAEDAFKLLGVTWIGCEGIAPFEIDLKLNASDESHFASTVFRLGTFDDQGLPKLFHHRIAPHSLVQKRPLQNCDWVIAIELTPPAQANPHNE